VAAVAQKKRVADAERKLAAKETKAAAESKRIAGNKVKQAIGEPLSQRVFDHGSDIATIGRPDASLIMRKMSA
jgi:hypothetical protein